MKLTLVLIVQLLAVAAFARPDRTDNINRLNWLMQNRRSDIWTCSTPSDSKGVWMFLVEERASGMFSSQHILAITDEAVCRQLDVVCPFISGVTRSPWGSTYTGVKHSYWATRGKYEDTVFMVSDGAGMKIASVSNGSQSRINWDRHWYFNPGECYQWKVDF
ncbi:MAG TPA: hypothetical protein VFV50_11705 [Bdellovibrionales bacterium]|nr:hypothetical protein [Bdellovibrionales bacterium]